MLELITVFIKSLALVLTLATPPNGKEDTCNTEGDPAYIDKRTGCLYVKAEDHGILPKLDSDGTQICVEVYTE